MVQGLAPISFASAVVGFISFAITLLTLGGMSFNSCFLHFLIPLHWLGWFFGVGSFWTCSTAALGQDQVHSEEGRYWVQS